jgi:hypothetical protein
MEALDAAKDQGGGAECQISEEHRCDNHGAVNIAPAEDRETPIKFRGILSRFGREARRAERPWHSP